MFIPDGYSDVPPGKLAAVVTCLEMRAMPGAPRDQSNAAWQLRREERPGLGWYRELYLRVGASWLWYSRLKMPDDELTAILTSPQVEVYSLTVLGRDEGLLELDFRQAGVCELAFFGLTSAVQGRGAGRWLMNCAIARAWSQPISRFWVHTCTLDHPAALAFYLRSGFNAYARRIEVADDPRLAGVLPRGIAPGIPIIATQRQEPV